jgi:hypothetical protein
VENRPPEEGPHRAEEDDVAQNRHHVRPAWRIVQHGRAKPEACDPNLNDGGEKHENFLQREFSHAVHVVGIREPHVMVHGFRRR